MPFRKLAEAAFKVVQDARHPQNNQQGGGQFPGQQNQQYQQNQQQDQNQQYHQGQQNHDPQYMSQGYLQGQPPPNQYQPQPPQNGYGYQGQSFDQNQQFQAPPGQQQYSVPQTSYQQPSAQNPQFTSSNSKDIFTPIAHGGIPIDHCADHPAPRHCIRSRDGRIDDPGCHPINPCPDTPLQTSKFYANLLLGNQGCSVWTHPYSVCWAKGGGNARSWGLSISQVDREQLAFGPATPSGASQYYINPVGIQSILLSATDLGDQTVLTTDSLQALSVNANFAPHQGANPVITFPLLQGMGFVTGVYKNCTPLIQSSVFFRELQPAGQLNNGATSKFRIILEDGKTWLLYLTPQAAQGMENLEKTSNCEIQARAGFTGTIQVAKLPAGCSEEFYDRSAGAYAISCAISGSSDGSKGNYSLTWEKGGLPNPLIMYALPHHLSSFTRDTASAVTPLRLQTTTKGLSTAVLADSWHLCETLPADISFAPWTPSKGSITNFSPAAQAAILSAAQNEADQDFKGQCCLDSMYFSGKGLGKFAMMLYVLHSLVSAPPELTNKVLNKLKEVFAVFVDNKQINPLVYEKGWRGVVSTAGLRDAGADFGNGYYNDHHFHYGYFVYAAAVIGMVDPNWMNENGGKNKEWVQMLVRDFANPINDTEFPFSRSFDWFHGHSWAKGLFESGDGKDEESTSEDSFASYALKMWGHTIGDANLEARGNLMLAIQARTFQTYFLMEESNTTQPEQIRRNKVTGITFENKVDHATYFGMNPEYIQGIHMIPLNPCSALIRTPTFVKEEWDVYFFNGRVDQVGGGWRGILYANLALVDPGTAYRFFAQENFDYGWIDGGASRTWYLAYTAALGGA